MIHWLCFINSFRKEVLFRCEFGLLRAQPCWFTCYQWGAEKGWPTTHLILFAHRTCAGLVRDIRDRECWEQNGSTPCILATFCILVTFCHWILANRMENQVKYTWVCCILCIKKLTHRKTLFCCSIPVDASLVQFPFKIMTYKIDTEYEISDTFIMEPRHVQPVIVSVTYISIDFSPLWCAVLFWFLWSFHQSPRRPLNGNTNRTQLN